MISRLIIILGILAITYNVFAYGPYKADVIRVLDGDTVEVRMHLYSGLNKIVKIRMDGINAPEVHTRRLCEKKQGLESKYRLEALLASSTKIIVEGVHEGKYAGRALGTIIADGVNTSDWMVNHGYAKPYHGGKRKPWC